MAEQSVTAGQVAEGEMLTELAAMAGEGMRAFILVGKLKSARRGKPNAAGDPGQIYAEVISGEGDTTSVTMDPKGTVPHTPQCGAFVLSPREYQGKLDGFTVTNMVLV